MAQEHDETPRGEVADDTAAEAQAKEAPERDRGEGKASRKPDAAATDSRMSRRGLFGVLAAGAAGLAIGGAGGGAIAAGIASAATGGSGAEGQYPFFGPRQSGITTAAQDRLHFAAFDVDADATRNDLVELLRRWSYAASRLVQGLDVSASGAVSGSQFSPPDDTGEALGLPPAGLTITIGFGPSLFELDGEDRFGVAAQRPEPLQRMPRFTGDALVSSICDGDLCVQACADDPQVAVHAIRNFTRMAIGTATLRWSQLGFGRTSSTSTSQATPRNLFGFKDGTNNIKAEDPGVADEQVWVQPGDGPEWLTGGSYLAARKIRMLIELWDRQQLLEQERVIGRDKREGAPLSGGSEFSPPDFTKRSANEATGDPTAIAADSHLALAHPDHNAGARMLRRGYNYVEGNDELGRLDAGLFFLAYVRHPEQFISVQRNLSGDLLNEYIKHVGSSLWAIPPGASEGGFVGETLFG